MLFIHHHLKQSPAIRRFSTTAFAAAKRSKKTEDPNKPKRALSAYMFFAKENREAVKQEDPSRDFGEIGRALGEKWRNLSASDRAPYEAKSNADKERYQRERDAYLGNL